MVGGTVMGYLGGLHYWWPKMTGRMYPEFWAKIAAMHHLRRVQPDVLPAVHPGLPGDAAALPEYPPEFQVLNVMSTAGASILGVGYLLPFVYLLVVAAVRQGGGPQPVGRDRAWSGDDLAAADGQLRRDAGGDPAAVRLFAERRPECLVVDERRQRARGWSPTTSRTSSSSATRGTLGMWMFLASEILFFGGCSPPTRSCALRLHPAGFAVASQQLNATLGGVNTAVLLTSSLTMALAVWAAQTTERASCSCAVLALTMRLRRGVPGIKVYEWYHEYEEGLVPGREVR